MGIGRYFCKKDINISTNVKTEKLDYIKIRNFFSSKVAVKRIKVHATKWKKLFAIHTTKDLLSGVYKEFYNLIRKPWPLDCFAEKRISRWIINYEKFLNLIALRKFPIKTMMWCYYTPTKLTRVKKIGSTKYWWGYETPEVLTHCYGSMNWCNTLEKSLVLSLYFYDSAYIQQKCEQKNIYKNILYRKPLFIMAKSCKQTPKCPLILEWINKWLVYHETISYRSSRMNLINTW